MGLATYGISKKVNTVQIKNNITSSQDINIDGSASFNISTLEYDGLRIGGNVTAAGIIQIGGSTGRHILLNIYITMTAMAGALVDFVMPFYGYVNHMSGVMYARDTTLTPKVYLYNYGTSLPSVAYLSYTVSATNLPEANDVTLATQDDLKLVNAGQRMGLLILAGAGVITSRFDFTLEIDEW